MSITANFPAAVAAKLTVVVNRSLKYIVMTVRPAKKRLMPEPKQNQSTISRRNFLDRTLRITGVVCLGSVGGWGLVKSAGRQTVWQIDPHICVQCGNCAINCVLTQSAVRCIHAFDVCGYCKLCVFTSHRMQYLCQPGLRINCARPGRSSVHLLKILILNIALITNCALAAQNVSKAAVLLAMVHSTCRYNRTCV